MESASFDQTLEFIPSYTFKQPYPKTQSQAIYQS